MNRFGSRESRAGWKDYSPFGMQMPGRSFISGSYRYGFNGKENDNEIEGILNQQDYGMRIYDPRLGRFLSVDPIKDDYPELTPFQFSSNSPVSLIDIDGKEGGWELSTPASNLKYLMDRNIVMTTKRTNNPATSPSTVQIAPVHSEAANESIRQMKLNAHRFDRNAKTTTRNGNLTKSFIESGNEVTDHAENFSTVIGKEKAAKNWGKAGTKFTGASVTYNVAKGDYIGATQDVAEWVVSKTPFGPYYYSAKVLKSMLFSDYNLSNAWWDAEQKKNIAINNMRYYGNKSSAAYNENESKKWLKAANENRQIQEGIEKKLNEKNTDE